MFWENFRAYALKSWQTSVSGIVTGLAVFLLPYGITLSEAAQQKLTGVILALGIMAIGLFAKDGHKSGKPGNVE